MQGVENYTVTQQVMGTETTTYFEREEGGDALSYTMYLQTPMGLQDSEHGPSGAAVQGEMLRAMRSRARDAGSEVVNGEQTVAVAVDDFGALVQGFADVPEAEDMEIETATFYFGADDHLVRRITMEGTAQHDGRPAPIEIDMVYSDFRTVGGLRHPFHTTMSVRGMEGTISPEEREQARRQLEEARRQMEQMPAQQRQMMERMMGDQLSQLEEMLGGEGLEMEVVVTDLKVNAGRPD